MKLEGPLRMPVKTKVLVEVLLLLTCQEVALLLTLSLEVLTQPGHLQQGPDPGPVQGQFLLTFGRRPNHGSVSAGCLPSLRDARPG